MGYWLWSGRGRRRTFHSRLPSRARTHKSPPVCGRRAVWILTGRRPALPHTCACSTIGAERLNFRVRDGNGWDPLAMVTRKPLDFGFEPVSEIGFPDQLGSLRNLEIEYLTGFTLPLVLKRAERCGPLCGSIERFASKANFMVKPNEQLVTVSSTHCCAYTPVLSNW